MRPWFRICKDCGKAYRYRMICPYCGKRNLNKTYGDMYEYIQRTPAAGESSNEYFFRRRN